MDRAAGPAGMKPCSRPSMLRPSLARGCLALSCRRQDSCRPQAADAILPAGKVSPFGLNPCRKRPFASNHLTHCSAS